MHFEPFWSNFISFQFVNVYENNVLNVTILDNLELGGGAFCGYQSDPLFYLLLDD